MHRLHRIRIGPFYKKLLLSYMVLLMVVVLVMTLVTSNLIRTISHYTDDTAWQAVKQYQIALEDKLSAIEGLPVELSFDDQISALLSFRGDFDPYTRYTFREIIKKLNSYVFLNDYIESIFFYLPEQQYIVDNSTVYSFAQWQSAFKPGSELVEIMDETAYKRWEALPGSAAMLCTMPLAGRDGTQGLMCVIVNPSKILFGSVLAMDNAEMQAFSFDSQGNILFSTTSTDGGAYPIQPGQIQPGIHTDGQYVYCAVPSYNYDLTHVVVIAAGDFNRTLGASKSVAIACILLVVCSGIAISIAAARYNYRPIQRIASIMGIEHHSNSATPLEYIENSINQLMERHNENSETYQQQQMDGLLTKLVYNEILNESLAQEYIEKNRLSTPGSNVLVMTLWCEEPVISHQVRLILEGALPEALPQVNCYYLAGGPHDCKIVFGFPSADYQVETVRAMVASLLEEQRDMAIIAVGEIHHGLTRLSISYEECIAVSDYMRFLGLRGVMTFRELTQGNHFHDDSLLFDTWFRKFANLIMDQDLITAQSIQTQIFDELKSQQYSLPFIKCKIFSFIDQTLSLIRELDANYTGSLEGHFSLSDKLLGCSSMEQLEEAYHSIFSQLSEILLTSSTRTGIIEKIRQITHDHYLDPAFNVSFLSDRLNVSTSYISKVFKKETGRNMLDYVQQMRLAHSKRLMQEEPELTIAAIAVQSGFYNDVSFIRVFKKYEGITPGKYRNQITPTP